MTTCAMALQRSPPRHRHQEFLAFLHSIDKALWLFRLCWMCIASSTNTLATGTPKSRLGWPIGHASNDVLIGSGLWCQYIFVERLEVCDAETSFQ